MRAIVEGERLKPDFPVYTPDVEDAPLIVGKYASNPLMAGEICRSNASFTASGALLRVVMAGPQQCFGAAASDAPCVSGWSRSASCLYNATASWMTSVAYLS